MKKYFKFLTFAIEAVIDFYKFDFKGYKSLPKIFLFSLAFIYVLPFWFVVDILYLPYRILTGQTNYKELVDKDLNVFRNK